MTQQSFIKLKRSDDTWGLLEDPPAFCLLTVIALRAKRNNAVNPHGLKSNQALIGDYSVCGLTRQQYRSAKDRLKHQGLIELRPTNKGTIATLVTTSIFDINPTENPLSSNHPATNDQPAGNHQATTNKNSKKEKNERSHAPNAEALRLAELLLDLLREKQTDFRQPNLDRWARDIDRLIRLDKRSPERIEGVIRWSRRDSFWQNNILSAASLRKHFDRLEMQMNARGPEDNVEAIFARLEAEGDIE